MNAQKTESPTPNPAWRWIVRVSAGVFSPAACVLLTLSLLAVVVPASASPNGAGGKRALDTMTMNLYIGTGVERVLTADPSDPVALITAVTGVYVELLGSQPTLRLQAVADQIAARKPDLVAVEEATLLRVQSPGDLIVGGTTPATDVVFDYLQILVDALKAKGVTYTVVSTSQEWDIEMPMLHLDSEGIPTGVIDDVRQTDREAILVRADLPLGQLTTSNPQHGHFAWLLPVPGFDFSITRGWCSVDVFTRGQNFRYICAHLEEETVPIIQILQAQELLTGPAATTLPVVLVGDFNSDPWNRDRKVDDLNPYPLLLAAGFQDAWANLHQDNLGGGLTWGHDEFLANPYVTFDRRIDFVFFRGPGFVPSKADVIDMALDRTERPLWASDHAAVAAELAINRAPFAKPGVN
jgi:endonuclease/exonuclease/phosphatase family metal-dependent hydrolase